jgi:hypothetical protein
MLVLHKCLILRCGETFKAGLKNLVVERENAITALKIRKKDECRFTTQKDVARIATVFLRGNGQAYRTAVGYRESLTEIGIR